MSGLGFESDSINRPLGAHARDRRTEIAPPVGTELARKVPFAALRYYRLEPRRVLSVSGTFAAGVLTITLDADSDTASVTHDGTNLLLNGSTDIDPGKAGLQEVLLTDLKDIVIEGKAARVDQAAVLDSTFNSLVNLSVIDVEQLTIAGSYSFSGDISVTLNGTGGISDAGTGSLSVVGTSYLDVGDADITLANSGNDFVGAVSLIANANSSNDVHLVDANDLLLSDVDVAGDLQLKIGGSLSNQDGVSIDVQGLTTIVADDGNDANSNNDIVLGDGATDSVTLNLLSIQTKDDVTLDLSSSVSFFGSNEAGSLDITTSGTITDEAATTLTVTGHGNFAGSSITLGDDIGDSLNLGSLTVSSTGDVAVTEDSGTILAGTNAAQNLTLISSGSVTNDPSTSLAVSNTLVIEATSVQLGNQAGDSFVVNELNFSTLGAFNLEADSNIQLLGDNDADTLSLKSTGSIDNAANATLDITNQAFLGGAAIQLGASVGDDIQFGKLTFQSTGSVHVEHDSDLLLNGTNNASKLTILASGKLSNTASTSIVVSGDADFGASEIKIGNQAGDSFTAGGLRFNSTGDVVIESDANITLDSDSTAHSLNLSSSGALTNLANASLDVALGATLNGASIDLGGQSGDGFSFGKLTFNATGTATIEEDSSTLLVGANTASQLLLVSTDSITNDAGTSLVVTGQAAFEATSLSIGRQAGDLFQAGSVGLDVSGAASIAEDNGTTLSGTISAQSLDLDSVGSISNSANAQISITDHADFAGTTIDLGQQALDLFQSGTLSVTGTGSVVVDSDANVSFSNGSSATTLTITSSGKISNEDNATISASNLATFDASQIDLGTSFNDSFNAQSLSLTSTGSATISEDSAMLLVGSIDAGNLVLTSTGSITNAVNATIAVVGLSSFEGTSIQVGNQAGDSFTTVDLTTNSSGSVELEVDGNANFVGTSDVHSLALTLTGSLTNSTSASLDVTTSAVISAASIDLGSKAGDAVSASSLTFNSAGDVSIATDASLDVVGTNTASSLQLTSTGLLSNAASASITTTGLAHLGGNTIDFGTQSGDILNFGQLSFQSTGHATIQENGDTALAGTSTAGSLTLQSTGAITNEINASLTVSGLAAIAGQSVLLGTTLGDSIDFGSISLTTTNDAVIEAESDLTLAGSTTVDNLSLTTSQSILTAAGASINVAGLTSLSGAAIQLGNAVGDTFNTDSVTFNSAGSVTISEDSQTNVTGSNSANTLLLESTGRVSNEVGSSISVNGKAGFAGSSIDLGNAAGDTFNVGTLYFNSTGDVDVSEDSSTRLTSTSTANVLDLTSSGSITNTSNAHLTVQGQGTLQGTSITLGTAAGDSFDVDAVNLNASGGVTFAANADVTVVGANTADSFDLRSTTSIVNTAGSSLIATNNVSLDAASIDFGTQAGDVFQSGSLTLNSTGDVVVAQDNATVIAGDNSADTLSLSSTATITNAANATMSIATGAYFVGTSLTLGDQVGDDFDVAEMRFVSGGDATFELNADVTLSGASSASSLSLTSTGVVNNDAGAAIVVSGATTLTAASVNLGTQVGDLFQTQKLTLLGNGDVVIEQDSDVLLTGTSQVDSLDISSTGAITNEANASVTIASHAAFSGSTIEIGNQAGDTFTAGSLSFDSTGTVTIAEDNAMVLAKASTATQSNLTSTGSISNLSTADVTVNGLTTLSGSSIALGGVAGDSFDLGELNFVSAGDVSIRVDDGLLLEGINTASNVTLAAVNALAMNTNATLTVTGAASLSGGSIAIGTQAGTSFNSNTLTVNSAGSAVIRQASATVLSGSSNVQDLALTSTGTVTNSVGAQILVSGVLDINATSVTLGNQAADNVQIASLRATTSDFTAELNGDVTWTGASLLDSLTLSSSGSVDNDAGATLEVTGATDLTAASISIGAQTSDLFNTATLTFSSGGAVTIHEDSSVDLTGTLNADSLDLRAIGSIKDFNGVTFVVSNSAFFGASSDILLGDDPTDTLNLGSLGLQGDHVVLSEDSSTHLDGVDVTTLSLSSEDLISQSGIDTGAGTGAIEVAGIATFDLTVANGDLLLSRASSNPPGVTNDGALMDNRFDGAVSIVGVTGDLRLRNTSSGAGIPVGFGSAFTNLELDFTASSIQIGSLNVSNDLIISSGGDIEDALGASITVGGDATFTASGAVTLSDEAGDSLSVGGKSSFSGDSSVSVGEGSAATLGEVSFNSAGDVFLAELDGVVLSGTSTAGDLTIYTPDSITNLANSSINVSGLATLQGAFITLGFATNDSVQFGELSLFSLGKVDLSLDGGTSLSDSWIFGDLMIESTSFVTSSDYASISVFGHTELNADSVKIGAGYSDLLWLSTLQFSSPNEVWIESDGDILLTGSSSADSLVLVAVGDIVGAAGGQLIARTAYFEADAGWGDIDLGSTGFTTILTLDSSDLNNSVGFYADNVYLKALGDVVLDDTWVFDTLYIETQGFIGGGTPRFPAGHVFQRDGSFVYAPYLGIDAMGAVQLSSFFAYEIAVSALQTADVISGIILNSVVEPAIAAAEFGVVLVSDYWTTVGKVFAPLGVGDSVEGITADAGHLYIETRYNSYLDLYANVVVNDPTKTITAIGDGGIYIFAGYFGRGTEGRVSSSSIPLQLNGYGAGTNFVSVDVLSGLQELAFNYGVWGDGPYSAQVIWADGEVDNYNAAQLTALNPSSSTIGDPNPIGNQPTIFVKTTPYAADLLLTASSLRSTLTIFGDPGIRLYSNDGLTNLNQATLEFTALVARDKLAIPLSTVEGYSPTFLVDDNLEDGALILSNQSQQQNDFDSEGSQSETSVAEVYTVRIVDGVELDRMSWSGEFGTGDVLEIKKSVLCKHKFLPGTYVIRRVTADGETVVIDEFVKGREQRDTVQEFEVVAQTSTRWYEDLPEFQTGETLVERSDRGNASDGLLGQSDSIGVESEHDVLSDVADQTSDHRQEAAPAAPEPDSAGEPTEVAPESDAGPDVLPGNPVEPGVPHVPGPEGAMLLPLAYLSVASLKRLRRLIQSRRSDRTDGLIDSFAQADESPSFCRKSRRARRNRGQITKFE